MYTTKIMYTNDADLYFILTVVNFIAYFLTPILAISALFVFVKSKQASKKTKYYIWAAILLVGAIIASFAYTGQLKPRCCGEGYTYTTVVRAA